jgi:hypothetical protein
MIDSTDIYATYFMCDALAADGLLEDAGEFAAAGAHGVSVGRVLSWRSSKARFSSVSPQKTS